MTIQINPPQRRKRIAWFKSDPPDEATRVFKLRDFEVANEPYDEHDLADSGKLSACSAVVFTETTKSQQLAWDVSAHAERLLNHGCMVFVIGTVKSAGAIKSCVERNEFPGFVPVLAGTSGRSLNQLPAAPYIHCWIDGPQWDEVANLVCENSKEPPLELDVQITFGANRSEEPDKEVELLLRRAFYKCSKVDLRSLEGGRSGAGLYRAHAQLATGLQGPWTQPYFVKIDERRKIIREYEIYHGHVDPYIPFHLGPQLLSDRCCLGGKLGILVGDYIEESESLTDCSVDRRSGTAIACLFDKTLLSWHQDARFKESSVPDLLLKHFPNSVSPSRFAEAKNLGAVRQLATLKQLFERLSQKPVLVGTVHGDLHAANVLVRGNDAIVIDFCRHQPEYPLLCDAASLEASLLVQGFSNQTTLEWMSSIRALYHGDPLECGVNRADPLDSAFWFHNCVHQIRRYARQWQVKPGQYQAVLALCLLEKASKDSNCPTDESQRRAAAYVFAEKLLLNAPIPD